MRTLEAQAAAVAAVRTGTDVAQLEAALQDDDEVAAADGIIAEAALADDSLATRRWKTSRVGMLWTQTT